MAFPGKLQFFLDPQYIAFGDGDVKSFWHNYSALFTFVLSLTIAAYYAFLAASSFFL
jgi:hypothetical protein